MKEGTKFHLKSKGHQTPRRDPSDLHIELVAEKECSSAFQRINENDLLYTHKCCLTDVIKCEPVCLTTFCGRNLVVPLDTIKSPSTV